MIFPKKKYVGGKEKKASLQKGRGPGRVWKGKFTERKRREHAEVIPRRAREIGKVWNTSKGRRKDESKYDRKKKGEGDAGEEKTTTWEGS